MNTRAPRYYAPPGQQILFSAHFSPCLPPLQPACASPLTAMQCLNSTVCVHLIPRSDPASLGSSFQRPVCAPCLEASIWPLSCKLAHCQPRGSCCTAAQGARHGLAARSPPSNVLYPSAAPPCGLYTSFSARPHLPRHSLDYARLPSCPPCKTSPTPPHTTLPTHLPRL